MLEFGPLDTFFEMPGSAAFVPAVRCSSEPPGCSRRPNSGGGELLLQVVQDLVARQNLGDARVRLAALADGGEELAILQLDPVHRHVHLRHIDLFILAVEEVIVSREVGAGITDVAKERAERAVIVEREAERADRAR